MDGTITDEELEKCATAYLAWINPPHSVRTPTEEDRHRVRAVLARFLIERQDGIKPCERNCAVGKHIHVDGRWIPQCSWHPGEYHMICGEACN
jgi:hypothetical protein